MEKSADSADRSRAASMTHDVAIRESAASIPRSVVDNSRHPSVPVNGPDRLPNDVWASAISRLQAQVSHNTGMLESHRRQFTDMETAITRLHQEMTNIVVALNEVRAEMRSRPVAAAEPARHDSGDLDVFAGQLQRLTNRVNEIDGLNMQMDLVKNRMQRLESAGPPTASVHPSTASQHNAHYREAVPPPPTQHLSHHAPPVPHPPLPPMRTASINSPQATRPPPHNIDPLASQGYRPSSESRPYPGEAATGPPLQGPGFRAGEALPSPSAISGWRPADSFPPGSGINAPGVRPSHAMEGEAHRDGFSGWAAVNSNPAIKRPSEESRSPFGSPSIDGSKRQRLAPLMPNMPRSSYGEENHPHQHPQFPPAGTTIPSEASSVSRSRAPSDGAQSLAQPEHPTPASQLQHSFRFITSTSQTDGSDAWRQGSDRGDHQSHPHAHGHEHGHGPGHGPPHGHGRGRGGRGWRGRGRGSRGGRGGAGAVHHHESQETGRTPEPEYASGHGSPANGHREQPRSFSPGALARGGFVRHGDSNAVGPLERQHEFPATPVQQPPPLDPYATAADGSQTSSGKKTRTKPIRNAEGILIRKDGRPDMRSVSSANNLRKVHAKKEAERAEMEGTEDGDGMTRSGTPTSAAAGEGDNDGDGEASEEPSDTQERHRQLMNQLYSSNIGGPGRVAEQFFPRHQDDPKAHTESERESREESTQGEDVVMKDMNDAQAEARGEQGDAKRIDVSSEQASEGEDRKVMDQPPTAA